MSRPGVVLHIAVWLLAIALAAVAYLMPLNVNDFLKWLVRFERDGFAYSWWAEFGWTSSTASDWRPLQLPIGHTLYIVGRGHEHLVFKGLLAGSILMMTWLFLRAIDVRKWHDVIAGLTAFLILVGHQAFAGAVEGVYPFGVEIILVVCELAVIVILMRERNVAGDVAVIVISLFAVLLNEKGGIVGAVYIVGCLLRMPGASPVAAGAVLVGYLAVLAARFLYYRPSASFTMRARTSDAWTMLFDAVSSPLQLLLSDPRYGQFRVYKWVLAGEPWAIITIASSVLTTALILALALFGRGHGRKIVVLLAVALAATTMFGAFSTKDYIPIMALPLYALAAFYALRWSLRWRRPWRGIAWLIAIALLAAWGVRAAGTGYYMMVTAHNIQTEWRDPQRYGAEVRERDAAIATPIMTRLRARALARDFFHPDDVLPPGLVRYLLGRSCPELCKDKH